MKTKKSVSLVLGSGIILGLGGLLAGCSMKYLGSEANREPASNQTGDSWTGNVELRDNTNSFQASDRPAGGWFVTPIHATLLPSGKVLITGWSRTEQSNCSVPHGTRRNGTTFLIDPAQIEASSGVFNITPIDEKKTNPADVIYCAGHTPLFGGRVLYTGGATYENLGDPFLQKEYGLNYARVFNPDTGTIFPVGFPLQGGPAGQGDRVWYPTNTRLADGRVLVSGGFTMCCKNDYNLGLEIFSETDWYAKRNPWMVMVPHAQSRNEFAPGLKDYSHNILLPQPVPPNMGGGLPRQIAMMGWQGKWLFLNVDPQTPVNQRFSLPQNAQRPGGAGWDSTAALVSTGELMTFGGTSDGGARQRADLYNPLTDQWRGINTGIGRHNASSVLLPDGTFLLISGSNGGNQGTPGDRRSPQIVDPFSGNVATFNPWPNDNLERGYHNFALLLKDGRILLGGGTSALGDVGCERTDMRIYSPAYLSRGPRPVIQAPSADITMKFGQVLNIGFQGPAPRARGGAALMALGSFTHSFDQNQRYIPLNFQNNGNGGLQIQGPANGTIAPPGEYMLYLVSDAGVPSVGVHVQLTP